MVGLRLSGGPARAVGGEAMTPEAKALAAARRWYQKDSLLTEPLPVTVPDVLKLRDAGPITAIEYDSRKYTGRSKIWRHEVTKPRRLLVSDGSPIATGAGALRTRRIDPETTLIEVGQLVSLETGTDDPERPRRVNLRRKNRLFVSTDGVLLICDLGPTIFVVSPGFRITKNGIEG